MSRLISTVNETRNFKVEFASSGIPFDITEIINSENASKDSLFYLEVCSRTFWETFTLTEEPAMGGRGNSIPFLVFPINNKALAAGSLWFMSACKFTDGLFTHLSWFVQWDKPEGFWDGLLNVGFCSFQWNDEDEVGMNEWLKTEWDMQRRLTELKMALIVKMGIQPMWSTEGWTYWKGCYINLLPQSLTPSLPSPTPFTGWNGCNWLKLPKTIPTCQSELSQSIEGWK